MKSCLLFAALLIGCGSDFSAPTDAPETGGSTADAGATEATGGKGALLATGGSSATAQATGGATHATGGNAATGGAQGTGGSAACVPITCITMTPPSGLSATPQTLIFYSGCGDKNITCICQMVQGTGGFVGYCR